MGEEWKQAVTAGKLMKMRETDGGEKPTKNEVVDLK